MKIDIVDMTIEIGGGREVPLPFIVQDSLNFSALAEISRILVSAWKTMEITVHETIRYSFVWTCEETGRSVTWIPRVTFPPTECAIERLRTIPGYLVSDIVRAMNMPQADIKSDLKMYSLDVDPFGYLECR